MHEVAPGPIAENWPVGQLLHIGAEPVFEYWPAGQRAHTATSPSVVHIGEAEQAVAPQQEVRPEAQLEQGPPRSAG